MLGFYTVNQVAEIFQTSKRNILGLIRKKQLRAFKLGKAYRIPIEELEKYINRSIKG